MLQAEHAAAGCIAGRQSVSVAHEAAYAQVHRSAAFHDRNARAKRAEQPGCRHTSSLEVHPRVLLGGKGMLAAGRQSGVG